MDLETAQAINQSLHWTAIKVEIDSWIAGQFEKMKTCQPDQLGALQARIAAYEEVKNLPQIVCDREE